MTLSSVTILRIVLLLVLGCINSLICVISITSYSETPNLVRLLHRTNKLSDQELQYPENRLIVGY